MIRPVSLSYSVDADDAFMFHALRIRAIDTEGLCFVHQRADTATLNRLAAEGSADVVAVSTGAYPEISASYLLLPHGASVGRGFGPVVVAGGPLSPGDLSGRRVAIPGTSTTAWLVLRLIEPRAVPVVVPIAPFGRVFDALESGEVDAALLIHEGRMLYREQGLHLVVDVGEWWTATTGLPLPLGVNVIRRDLGEDTVARVSRVLRASIAWALEHRDQAIAALEREDRGDVRLKDPALLDRYLALYANQDTLSMADDARRGVDELFRRAAAAGLMPTGIPLAWAP